MGSQKEIISRAVVFGDYQLESDVKGAISSVCI